MEKKEYYQTISDMIALGKKLKASIHKNVDGELSYKIVEL